jgi:S-adenosylmethionine:tRNA ribosyltransferase-isomerase
MRDYTYQLPEDRIASFPLERRDQAKLLVYRDGRIDHAAFSQLSDYLEPDSLLFFNDTRVIPARLLFHKATGAQIEVLLLAPLDPALQLLSMTTTGRCVWRCIIGNLKRWNESTPLLLQTDSVALTAALVNRDTGVVEFSWTPEDMTFASVLDKLGGVPLPPYLNRQATEADRGRYQTLYAHHDGAVAAPTAGLHFTDEVLASLSHKGITSDFLTLHVSAGTFLPVKTDNAKNHTMHEEQVIVTRQNIVNLLREKKVVSVGTTTMRTLESLYWYGCLLEKDPSAPFHITQEMPYSGNVNAVTTQRSFQNVLRRLGASDQIHGSTSIFIHPGYSFHVCDALITNFHQPGSTLLLLVAAFAGSGWKNIYNEALTNHYRFLSYGDSSLIFNGKSQ